MTISRHHVSFKTYALAFAVVLSPALMQTGGSCEPNEQLEVLELEDENGVPLEWWGPTSFDPGFMGDYLAWRICDWPSECLATPDLTVRALATNPESPVEYTYTWNSCVDETGNPVECPAPISGSLGPGGGEVVLEGALQLVPSCSPGVAELRIDVWCAPTHSGVCVVASYTVLVFQGYCDGGGPICAPCSGR